MARCCGAGSGCDCRVTAGENVTVEGTGSIGDPFIVSATGGGGGIPNSLSIGTVTTGAPGSDADADITGTPPNQILDLTIPRGDVGPSGSAGPANTLSIGTVTTGAPGSPAAANITGTSPSQVLNLTIPEGEPGQDAANYPTELPTYAGTDREHQYAPLFNSYNASATALRRARLALMKAVNGTSRFSIACMGDSSLVGFNGTSTIDRLSIPKQIALALSRDTGVQSDTGLTVVPQAVGTISDRVTYGGAAPTYNAPFATIPYNTFWTYESEDAGDEIVVMWTGLSSNWSYSVDGGALVNVTSPGTATHQVTVISGLSNTTHQITFDPTGAAGTFMFITAIWIRKSTSAISVHNLAFGGSQAASGAENNNWTTGVSATGLTQVRAGMRAALPLDPDVVFISIGPNDLAGGATAATALAGLETMLNWYPNASKIISANLFFSGTDPTQADLYTEGKFALADEYNAVVLDWRNLMVDYANALAFGLLGPDNAHFIHGAQAELARQVATLISGGGMPASPPPQTTVATHEAIYYVKPGDAGKRLRFTSATAVAVVINNTLPHGFACEWEQYGAGTVTFNTSGATLRSRGGASKSAGQYAVGGISRIDSDEFALYGDVTT